MIEAKGCAPGDDKVRNHDQSLRPGLNIRIDPPLGGRENMAIDRDCLNQTEVMEEPVTVVRFYRWKSPTVSVGRYQEKESVVDCAYCRQHYIDVVRRPTGGRAVLHGDELTYAVISNQIEELGNSISAAYLTISKILWAGLCQAGVDVDLDTGSPASSSGPRQRQACFSSVSRYELTWKGQKIVGSAQRRLRRSFLQHGSIPLSIQYDVMSRSLGNSESRLRKTMASVSEALSRPVSFEFLQPHLQREFEANWGFKESGCRGRRDARRLR